MLELDPDGGFAWSSTEQDWPVTNDDQEGCAAVDALPDGSFGVLGGSPDGGWLTKFSTGGEFTWRERVLDPTPEHFLRLRGIAAYAGGFVTAASFVPLIDDVQQPAVLELRRWAPDGETVWRQSWSEYQEESPLGLAVGPDGSAYVLARNRDADGNHALVRGFRPAQ